LVEGPSPPDTPTKGTKKATLVARNSPMKRPPEVNSKVVSPGHVEQSTPSRRPTYKGKSPSKHDRDSDTNTNCNTEPTIAESEEMAVEVLERLFEHMELQKKVSELTIQVDSLRKQNSAEKDRYDQLWPQYEQAFENLLVVRRHLEQKNNEFDVEVSRNGKHVNTIATLTNDLKTTREEIERLTDLNDAQNKKVNTGRKDIERLTDLYDAQTKQIEMLKERVEVQKQEIEQQRPLPKIPSRPLANSTGTLVLEVYTYQPMARHFKLKGIYTTNTAEVTDWVELGRVARKYFRPDFEHQDSITQVQDVVFADEFTCISPKYFTVWLSCLKADAVGERRCRCLWYPEFVPRAEALDAARQIPIERTWKG